MVRVVHHTLPEVTLKLVNLIHRVCVQQLHVSKVRGITGSTPMAVL